MKKLALLFAVLALVGCRTKPIAVVPDYSLQVLPAVGSTATVGVGEHLLTQGNAMTVDAVVVRNQVSFDDIVVAPGTYPQTHQNDEYRMFQKVVMTRAGQPLRNGKLYLFHKDASSPILCLDRKRCVEADFTVGKSTTYSRSSNQQTLIYSGRIGSRVTLGYREFANDFARPAFSNDVDYDVAESRILGYKGARIEVIDATNTEITYKVLAGFK
ncbi:hypothetical protein [Massilia aurea]|uniref:hypothetical protein n=1 Tax=Massilia aurea TaxID=373040 RepID=UPI001611F916|nr:hypothetical protein [Massilia aurea]